MLQKYPLFKYQSSAHKSHSIMSKISTQSNTKILLPHSLILLAILRLKKINKREAFGTRKELDKYLDTFQ